MTSPPSEMAPFPFEDYLVLESTSDTKHEWINGLVYAMSRGTPEHGRLSAAVDHPDLRRWEQELADATHREQEEHDLFDRELFYAIQPRERLEGLAAQYRSRFGV